MDNNVKWLLAAIVILGMMAGAVITGLAASHKNVYERGLVDGQRAATEMCLAVMTDGMLYPHHVEGTIYEDLLPQITELEYEAARMLRELVNDNH